MKANARNDIFRIRIKKRPAASSDSKCAMFPNRHLRTKSERAGNCMFSIGFSVAALGRNESIIIVHNALAYPESFSLSGIEVAVAPGAFYSSSLTFAASVTGTMSAPQIVKLTNTGSGTAPVRF